MKLVRAGALWLSATLLATAIVWAAVSIVNLGPTSPPPAQRADAAGSLADQISASAQTVSERLTDSSDPSPVTTRHIADVDNARSVLVAPSTTVDAVGSGQSRSPGASPLTPAGAPASTQKQAATTATTAPAPANRPPAGETPSAETASSPAPGPATTTPPAPTQSLAPTSPPTQAPTTFALVAPPTTETRTTQPPATTPPTTVAPAQNSNPIGDLVCLILFLICRP